MNKRYGEFVKSYIGTGNDNSLRVRLRKTQQNICMVINTNNPYMIYHYDSGIYMNIRYREFVAAEGSTLFLT
jgi:hypothetical protein